MKKSTKSFLLFLTRFLGAYVVLTILYTLFLNQYDINKNQVDAISVLTANLTAKSAPILNLIIDLSPSDQEPAILLTVNHDKTVAKIIEGCNSISVIILFLSFIAAFYSEAKKTIAFMLLGSLLIFNLNILRINLFVYGLYFYPKYRDFLHDILFPISIYGLVFLLWLLWIFKLSSKK